MHHHPPNHTYMHPIVYLFAFEYVIIITIGLFFRICAAGDDLWSYFRSCDHSHLPARMLEMLPYMELMLLIIGLVSKKTAGVSNCRTSFSNKDHVLIGHVIRTLKNKAFESCTFSCELEPQCFSVNYIASRRTCELNNVAKDYFPGDLVARKGAFYMDMVIRKYHPCASLRCENGGTCISSPSLKCKCVKGFSGVRCESINSPLFI